MFVVSFSSKNFKKIILPVFCFAAAVCAVVLLRCFLPVDSTASPVETVGKNITDTSQLLSFISSFGWEVDEEPDEVREVIIPAEFDDVYENYNAIQLKQGYDLKKYAGERVKRWTYTVRNYPDYIDSDCIKINILVYGGEVIGGDVCSVRLDGFMHGFKE